MHIPLTIPRFYPILDVAAAGRHGFSIVLTASDILEAGAKILQFRHKGFFSRELFATLEEIGALCREAGAMLVVNDRADLARMLAVNGLRAGVHLGQDDLAPSLARRVTGDDALIGFSTHNERQLRDAQSEPADYFAFGPVFATVSKQNPDPVAGLDELKRLRTLVSRPFVAIGGITRERARSVFDAGADSVAVIGDLYPEVGRIRDRAAEWLAVTSVI